MRVSYSSYLIRTSYTETLALQVFLKLAWHTTWYCCFNDGVCILFTSSQPFFLILIQTIIDTHVIIPLALDLVWHKAQTGAHVPTALLFCNSIICAIIISTKNWFKNFFHHHPHIIIALTYNGHTRYEYSYYYLA